MERVQRHAYPLTYLIIANYKHQPLTLLRGGQADPADLSILPAYVRGAA